MDENNGNPKSRGKHWWGRCVALFVAGAVIVAGCERTSDPPHSNELQTIVAPGVDIAPAVDELPAGSTYINITDPPANLEDPVIVGPMTTFRWLPRQGSSRPAEIRWILVGGDRWKDEWDGMLDWIRSKGHAVEWTNWYKYEGQYWPAPGYWTTPMLKRGSYVFAVQGRDGNGVEETEFDFQWNARKILVDPAAGGPVMTVYNEYMDPVISTSDVLPPVIFDIAANVPLQFCWTADASDYCGAVKAYRYGWDIQDLDDPTQWETDWVPYDGSLICAPPRTYAFDSHTFYVEVMDDRGMISRLGVVANIVPLPARFFFTSGSCDTPLSLDRKGTIRAIIPGMAGWDVHDIELSTVRLEPDWDHPIVPSTFEFRDIMSPLFVYTVYPESDNATRPQRGPDGIDDLVLTFSAAEIARYVGVTAPQEVWVPCRVVWNGYWVGLDGCMRIVGNPGKSDAD